jgi:hypothetical protein
MCAESCAAGSMLISTHCRTRRRRYGSAKLITNSLWTVLIYGGNTMKEKPLNEFKNSLQLLELIQMAKAGDSQRVRELYEWTLLTGLKGGQIADRAKAMLANELIPEALENLLTNPAEVLPEMVEDKSQKIQNAMQEYHELMNEIFKNPDASVVAHFRNLGWSSGRGSRVKAEMLAQELLESETVKAGQGRPKEILKITNKAKELFGL